MKVACFIAWTIGGLFLLSGVLLWMQGGFSFWSSDIVPIPTATPVPPGYVYEPEVSVVWVEESFKSRKHRLSMRATDLDPSVEYEIRVHVSIDNAKGIGGNAIGFNPDCSEDKWTGEFNPDSREERTSGSQTVTLFTCDSDGGGSVIVELFSGDALHGSHTETVEVRDFVPR